MNSGEQRAAWEAAYRATEYRVELPGGVLVLRVQRQDAAADERLRHEAGVLSRWAIVTPCNPASRPLPPEENAARLRDLQGVAAALKLACCNSRNHDPSGNWPDEPGLLLCDPPPGLAEDLGRRFGQNAILAGTLSEAPRLVWLED